MKNKKSDTLVPVRLMLNTAIGLALCSGAWAHEANQLPQLPTVTVIGEKVSEFGMSIDGKNLSSRRLATNDTATLLDGVPALLQS